MNRNWPTLPNLQYCKVRSGRLGLFKDLLLMQNQPLRQIWPNQRLRSIWRKDGLFSQDMLLLMLKSGPARAHYGFQDALRGVLPADLLGAGMGPLAGRPTLQQIMDLKRLLIQCRSKLNSRVVLVPLAVAQCTGASASTGETELQPTCSWTGQGTKTVRIQDSRS